MHFSRRNFLRTSAATSLFAVWGFEPDSTNAEESNAETAIAKNFHLNYSNRARNVMRLASQQAGRLDHGYIGTEHLFLALFAESELGSDHWLAELGPSYKDVFSSAEIVIGSEELGHIFMGKLPHSDNVKDCIERLVSSKAHRIIHPADLMLSLLDGFGTKANLLMREMWIDESHLRELTITAIG